MKLFEINNLKSWFLSFKRDLPWRQDSTPYKVWISEVMLQQTQVSVVIPYFLRWIEEFPTVFQLAEAPLERVIKIWEGLGYYSRARNLHEGAKQIVQNFGGVLPTRPEDLKKIKGLGEYTVGAICSFAYHQRIPAVDGNVLRVMARYFEIEGDISKNSTKKEIQKQVAQILTEGESWLINEGLIELGALVCTKQPKCHLCPLKQSCLSFSHGSVDRIPYNSKKYAIENLYRAVAVLRSETYFLLQKGKKGEIMQDLHEFPFFETDVTGLTEKIMSDRIKEEFNLDSFFEKKLEEVSHSFTRYKSCLKPVCFTVHQPIEVEGHFWAERGQMRSLPFSSGHKKILNLL